MLPRSWAATCWRAAGCSMSERGRLCGKVAAVTGAAAGIGEATAELFAEEGASVVLLDVDPAGEEVAARLRNAGAQALFVHTDIAREAEVAHAFGVVAERHGRLDVLVNDAAVFVLKGLEASVEDWQRSLGVNVVGTALCTRHAADVMRRTGGGAIVNLASISSFIAQPGFLTYSATKAALVNMTRCMALELAPDRIRVNCVCPGTIRTAATDRHMSQAGISEAEFLAEQGALHLLGRVGTPREVAHAILFLASDQASFITATPLLVDGGYLAR
jgi:NAD(P)-dependent dehydrogenase (short-subunit alcohol dehydrogenase family)